MKKAIVTGGAGFIGSHITEELVKRGYRVTVIDNLTTGRLANLDTVLSSKNAEFVRGSITNLSLLRKIFSGADFVFHQAAIPSVPRSIKNPRASNNANANGTLNVLLAARDTGVKKVVYASSSSVYGDTPTLPKTEDMTPNPLSPYAVAKLAGEYYCRVFNNIYGLGTVCLRYFNVYGPRQDPNSPYAAVIPLFFRNALDGKSPVIFGDGEQSRDFTFVKDVANANIQAAESNATGVFNLGNSQRITINQLVQLIINLAGNKNVKPTYRDPRPGDILHSLADISSARKAFGYNPKYSLEEGLKQVVASMREQPGRAV
jgi:UDP-glucose 4-epimerase